MIKKTFLVKIFLILFVSAVNLNLAQDDLKKDPVDLKEFLGVRLYKIFEVFGNPYDLFCSADGKSETILDYGTFAFQVGNKTVNIVYFWENFKGIVFEVSIGTSSEDLFKKYGKPTLEKRSTIDGNVIWVYNLVKTDRMFVVFFDKDNKISRMQIEWII